MINLSARQVTGVTLISSNGVVECRREPASGEWRLVRPISYRADQDEMDRILGTLESAVVHERISAEQRQARGLRFADYGLARPSHRVVVDDGGARRILMMGAESPLGDQIYVRVAGEADVMAVSRELLGALQPEVDALRDRSILRGVASSSMRVEIERPQGGFIQLLRSGGRWMLQQPMSARADDAKIDALVEAAFDLRVERYVWDPLPGTPAAPPAALPTGSSPATAVRDRVEPYGLGAGEAVRLAIWSLEPDSRQDLLLGKPTVENPEWVYAKRSDSPSILAVSRKALALLAINAHDVRDRQVFPFGPDQVRQVQVIRADHRLTLTKRADSGWMLTDPVQAKADDVTVQAALADLLRWRVSAYLDVSQTNQASLGLAPAAWSLQMWTRLPAAAPVPTGGEPGPAAAAVEPVDPANPATVCLRVSAVGPETNLLYALVQGGRDVMALPAAVAAHPALEIANSLAFLDRTVLAVPSAQIQKVSVVAGLREESVLRDDSGAWSRAEAPNRQVNRDAVESLLFCVANLRSLRVESSAPADLSPYGLDQPVLIVTLRLTGEAGIQKTLMVGKGVEGAGAYAMVKGQDMVFVLGPDAVRILAADLTGAAAGAPSPAMNGTTSALPPPKVSP
jgi:hypothetical protein